MNKRLVRYVVVGGTAYLIEMAVLFGLHDIMHLSSVESVAISFWVGLCAAFIMQKLLVFKNYDKRTHILGRQLLGYSLLVAWNYLFTLVLVKLLDKHLSVFVIRTFAILVMTTWNYLIYQKIFKHAQ